MATQSNIIAKLSNGNYTGIYCHYDGYPEGVGTKLLENYSTLEDILELFSLGDIRVLEWSLDKVEAFDVDLTPGEEYTTLDSMFYHDFDYDDYTYVFEDGKWSFFSWSDSNHRVDLAEFLNKDKPTQKSRQGLRANAPWNHIEVKDTPIVTSVTEQQRKLQYAVWLIEDMLKIIEVVFADEELPESWQEDAKIFIQHVNAGEKTNE